MNLRALIFIFALIASRVHADGPVEDFLRKLFARPDQYVALGKIMTGPPFENASDYYARHLRTLQSAGLLEAARKRMAKLHPEVPPTRVEIRVMRSEGSSLFRVAAIGDEPKYTRQVLDALLDEFIAKYVADTMADKQDCLARLLQELSSAEKECLDSGDKLAAAAGNPAAEPAKLEQELEKAKVRYESVRSRLEKYDFAGERDRCSFIFGRPLAAIPTR